MDKFCGHPTGRPLGAYPFTTKDEHMLQNPNWDKVEIKIEPYQQALLDAATYLETHGWCQNRAYDGDKSCMAGAVYRVIHGKDFVGVELPLYRQARFAIVDSINDLVVSWNDKPGRTVEEVTAALREAAKVQL